MATSTARWFAAIPPRVACGALSRFDDDGPGSVVTRGGGGPCRGHGRDDDGVVATHAETATLHVARGAPISTMQAE